MSVILGSTAFEYNGAPGISLVRKRRTRSATYGLGWMLEFMGTPAAINAAFLSLPSWCDGDTDESGPMHTLIVRYSDDPSSTGTNTAFDTFELLGNDNQLDILEHPKALALDRTLVEDVLRLANKTELTAAEETEVAGLAGDSAELYDYIKRRNGSGSFQDSQFVFRATKIVSRRAQISVAYANLNRLYTFAQLATEAAPPSGYIISLDAISTQCAPESTPDGYAWRWLKSAPTITAAPGNRLAIQVEWKLAEWATWVYANKA